MTVKPAPSFKDLAQAAEDQGIVREFLDFLRFSKKWWLLPIMIVLLGLAVFMVLTSSAAAPFIYALF